TAFLSALTVLLYVMVYTPLKKRTWLNTLVGAIPGALPLLGGWSAATGTIHPIAWPLFIVLFAWQHPHFYALAIMYEEDYGRGGLKMLPVIEVGYARTSRQTLIYTVMMVVASLFTYFIGLMGPVYLIGICCLNVMMAWYAIKMAMDSTIKSARKLFFASIIYLPGWFILIVVDYYLMPLLR
ncbi:MAG: protoheme IX farnesyltransferase, partial [bacterium]|nr:protoheme IX farnesyltransferase [bacterium]